MEGEDERGQDNDELEPEDKEGMEEEGDIEYVEDKEDNIEVEVEDEGESEGKATMEDLEEEEAQESEQDFWEVTLPTKAGPSTSTKAGPSTSTKRGQTLTARRARGGGRGATPTAKGGTPTARGGKGPPTAKSGGGPPNGGRGGLMKSKSASGGSGDVAVKCKLTSGGATPASKKGPSTLASKQG